MIVESCVDAAAATRPLPPKELQHRVSGGFDEGPTQAFHRYGRQTALDLEASLAAVERRFDSFSSILEFGCGCGRVLMWLQALAQRTSVHGVDIDREAIEWARENVPSVTFRQTDPRPPLPFPDETFDLVVNHSVFTHLDAEYQDEWLSELQRVTRPGGVLVLSVHGEHAFQLCEENARQSGEDPGRWRSVLARTGILFIADDDFLGGPFPEFYHSTFHAPWYVFSHWGSYFRILAYLPRRGLGHQDYVVLQRPPVGEEVGEPLTPRTEAAPAPPAAAGDAPDAVAAGFEAVLDGSQTLSSRATDVSAPTLYRRMRRTARRALLVRARDLLAHQDEVNRALAHGVRASAEAIAGLREQITAGGNRAERITHVVLQRQGDRINRLEEDLWKAIRAHDEAFAALKAGPGGDGHADGEDAPGAPNRQPRRSSEPTAR